MKKDEFVTILSEEMETTKSEAEWIYNGFCSTVFKVLAEGLGDVTLANTVKLKTVDVKERNYRVPKTGEIITKPAHKRLKSTPLKKIKDVLGNK